LCSINCRCFTSADGVCQVGGIANYFPSSVIKGLLTSIGILIIAKQIPHAFGYDKDAKGNLTELIEFGDEDWHELLQPFQHVNLGVLLICIVSILIMLVWDKPFIKKRNKINTGRTGGSRSLHFD
jgi:MFS superfamily sulfate permease-like transporter